MNRQSLKLIISTAIAVSFIIVVVGLTYGSAKSDPIPDPVFDDGYAEMCDASNYRGMEGICERVDAANNLLSDILSEETKQTELLKKILSLELQKRGAILLEWNSGLATEDHSLRQREKLSISCWVQSL